MLDFSNEIDESTQALPEEDPVIRAYLEKQASVGNWEIARNTYKYPSTFSNTGTKEELIELETNLRALIDEGIYGYTQIEKMLVMMGYQHNKIRQMFKRITGVDPEVYVCPELTKPVPPPGNIPTVNYGWGFAKGKEFESFFIMPFDNGYAVFGQKNDLVREMIKVFPILADARKFVSSKVKELYYYDKIVDLKKSIPTHREDFIEPVEMIRQGSVNFQDLYNYFLSFQNISQKSELISLAGAYLEDGRITRDEYKKLMTDFNLIREAETTEFKEQEMPAMEFPTEDIDEKHTLDSLMHMTPEQFLEEFKTIKAQFPNLTELAMQFTNQINETLENYTIEVIGVHYLDMSGKVINAVDVTTMEKVNLSFVIAIRRKDISDITKLGVATLIPVNNTFNFPTAFMADDRKIYKFNDVALDKLFAPELENKFNY